MDYEKDRAEHYHRLRTDPMYRMQEQMADLECMSEPAHYYQEPLVSDNYTVGVDKGYVSDKRIMEMESKIKNIVIYFNEKINLIHSSKKKRILKYD